MAYFKVLSRSLAWKTEKDHENLSGYPAFGPRFETGSSKYQKVLTTLRDIRQELFVNTNLEESDLDVLEGTVQCFVLSGREKKKRKDISHDS